MMVGQWQGSRKSVGDFLSAVSLLSQTAISFDLEGELVVSGIADPSGDVRRWVEIAPFVSRDANGHDRLAAKLVDDKVVRWSWDLTSPWEVFERVPWGGSSVWILLSLAVSLGVLLLSFVYWPVGALIRRHYRAPLTLTGSQRPGYRLSRLLAGLSVAVAAGWSVTISGMLNNVDDLTRRSDPTLWALQFSGLFAFAAAVLVTGWTAWLAWEARHRWPGLLWSLLMFLSALLVLYVAWTAGLLAMTVHY